MNLSPENQTSLYGLKKEFNELMRIYNTNFFPNKILLSGPKGIGKCTLSYHFINFVLSLKEENSYDTDNNKINSNNKSFKLIQNKTNPNFSLIDVLPEKKNIDISQIRNLINYLNKSSFNDKPRFILIDNIDLLNLNSTNALLKIIEEPSENVFFILINNNKQILPTLKSRCLNFNISLSHNDTLEICNQLFKKNIFEMINKDLLGYYFTPGKLNDLINFFEENSIDSKNLDLKNFLSLIIDNSYYKKKSLSKNIIYSCIELFLSKKISKGFIFYDYFIKQIDNVKRYNLDEESFFFEFKHKMLNE